jgi:hypothetical protein
MDRRGFLSLGGLAVAAAVVPTGFASAGDVPSLMRKGTVKCVLSRQNYTQGEVMTLIMRETISARRVSVTDSSGTVWKRTFNDRDHAIYKATAGDQTSNQVTVVVTRRRDGRIFRQKLAYTVTLLPSSSDPGDARWPGHHPGQIMLGLSSADLAGSLARTGPVGLRRTYYNWGDAGEDSAIKADHASGRLPWVSFKPPGGTAGWAAIAAGTYDADIKARATRYAGYAKAVISTFHHEPTNDSGDPGAWAAAYTRIYDVMNAETGLKNVTFAPIIGDWEFNPRNKDGQPGAYLTAPVLERIPFMGVDLYQNSSNDGFDARLTRIIDWLEYRGVTDPMVGIGETGCCLSEDPQPEAWLQANWDWAVANADKIGAISYFDSTRNSKDAHVWRLDETTAKLNTYKRHLASDTSATL